MVRGLPWRAGPLRVVAGSVRRSPSAPGGRAAASPGLAASRSGRAGRTAWPPMPGALAGYSLLLVSANSRANHSRPVRAGDARAGTCRLRRATGRRYQHGRGPVLPGWLLRGPGHPRRGRAAGRLRYPRRVRPGLPRASGHHDPSARHPVAASQPERISQGSPTTIGLHGPYRRSVTPSPDQSAPGFRCARPGPAEANHVGNGDDTQPTAAATVRPSRPRSGTRYVPTTPRTG
jgi:hypothetical protein